MANPTPVIETRGLTKVFKDFWMRPRVTAVEALDLRIEPHEVHGLLGPNGSGKSTTIKILLGLLFPTKGRVAVFGKRPTDVTIKKRIGYLPEESYLYRFLNARETLDYYGKIFGLDRHQRRKRIDELLEWVGLTAVQRRPVGEYSKGMQRRIGLAQALINGPDLLILDEPTSGMDPLGTRQIKDLILRLKEKGTTVLLSSHLLADVEDVCDRVSILYGGRIRAEGTVDELLSISESTVIETPRLKPETIARIEQMLEAEEGLGIDKVHAPRQKLEALFLDIVNKAQAEGTATGGAQSGGRLAAFLQEEAESAEGEKLIDQLVRAPAEPVEAPATPAPDPAATQTEGPEEKMLDALVAGEEASTTPPDGPPEPEPPQSDQGPDKSVIDDLVGDGDKP
ncbi:MAG: ABC transporter ATP-binding protein [Phycisphaeraceae bacterium]|nr:ABC transporter ATP-binding protein [Phycisphaeraceae bacterium]